MSPVRRAAAVLLAALALAGSAICDETASYRAGTRRDTWWNSPSAWGQDQWKIGLAGNSMYAGNLERGRSLGFGGQLAYQFFDLYSLCLAFDNYRATDDDPPREDFNVIAGVLTFRVHLTIAQAFPAFYGGPGLGLYSLDTPDDANRFLLNGTFGIEYAAFHPFSLFLEYRYAFRDLRFQGDDDHGLFRFGANYAF